MDDLLSEILTETSESLESFDAELVKLEQTPNDPDLLGDIFRLIHTIKGTSGFLGLPRLETEAHHGENVLGNFRDGTQDVTPDAVSLILAALDCIKLVPAGIEETDHQTVADQHILSHAFEIRDILDTGRRVHAGQLRADKQDGEHGQHRRRRMTRHAA
jgi:two-component system chemotaxis sensor kinase CheA